MEMPLAGQFKLNFYTPELSINACTVDGTSCGSRITMANFALELALGNQLQPVFFDVNGSGNFVVEIAAIDRPSRGAIGLIMNPSSILQTSFTLMTAMLWDSGTSLAVTILMICEWM